MVMTMEDQLVIVTGMVLAIMALGVHAYDRDQAAQRKQLVRIPVKAREKSQRASLPDEETGEVTPAVYYIGLLIIAYLITVILVTV